MSDLKVTAGSDLEKAILELRVHAEKAEQLLPTIAEMLVGAVQDVFEAEGPGWEPLAEATKRNRRGGSHKILQDTGVMAASVDPRWGADYAEAVGGASYTIFHVKGTSRMPKRNPFDLGPFEQPLLEEVAALLTEQVTS